MYCIYPGWLQHQLYLPLTPLALSPSLSLVLFVCFKRGEHWRLMKGIGKKEARHRKSCPFLLHAGKCAMEGACQSLRPKRNLCVDAGAGLNTARLMSIEVDYRRTAAMLKEIFVFSGGFMCFVPFNLGTCRPVALKLVGCDPKICNESFTACK